MTQSPFVAAFRDQLQAARLLFVAVVILTGLVGLLFPEYFHTCDQNPYKRHENPDSLNTAPITQESREGLFFHFVYGLHAVLLITTAALYRNAWWTVVAVDVLCLGLYFPGLFAVESLKRWSGDTACRPANEWPLKSNGVSGHFFYISYQILLTHYLACLYTGARDRKYRVLPVAMCASAVMVNGVTTWTYGYHSLRQICLGAIMGIAYSTLVVLVSSRVGDTLQGMVTREATYRK